MRRPLLVLLSTAAIGACGSQRHLTPPPAPPIPLDGALHVVLSWTAPVDLDLYLTDPAGESLYFANNPTRGGARLAADARCADVTGPASSRVEHAIVTTPVPGWYRVGVDYLDDCGSGIAAVPFSLAVARGSDRRETTGDARRGVFNVVVLEFEVGEDGHIVSPTAPGER